MSSKSERKRMAFSSGQTIERRKSDEHTQPSEEPKKRSQLEKSRCEIEDRIDFKTVRHARMLAVKRGEQPMAWEAFKKKLDR